MFECGFLSLLSTVLTEMQGTIGMDGRDPKYNLRRVWTELLEHSPEKTGSMLRPAA